jgi:sortase (surface protein transpeptidase)
MSEVIIYHCYSAKPQNPPQTRSGLSFLDKLNSKMVLGAKLLTLVGIFFLIYSFLPSFWYAAKSGGKNLVSRYLLETAEVKTLSEATDKTVIIGKNLDYQPNFDARLPLEAIIKIPSIGLNGKINEATFDNYEFALKRGVWRVSDFGTPMDRTKPTILAAHRFGYLAWSNLYRRQNSFFNLPKLKVGDLVEIDWKQRKYLYEVYGEAKGEEIDDYQADLILYTCEALNSSVRIFKYAKLLKI